MKLLILAIRDAKSQLYGNPLFFVTKGAAVRAFSDVINDGKSDYAKHPEDYSLWQLGTYDDQTGDIAPLDKGILPVIQGITLRTEALPADPAQLTLEA